MHASSFPFLRSSRPVDSCNFVQPWNCLDLAALKHDCETTWLKMLSYVYRSRGSTTTGSTPLWI